MARKRKPVSLAPISAPRQYPRVDKTAEELAATQRKATSNARQSAALAAAGRALATFEAAGYRAPVTPTAERLVKAAGAAKVEKFNETVEISKGDRFESVSIEHVRIRISDAPIDRLKAKKLLAPKNPDLNVALWFAGSRYQSLWKHSGVLQIKSVDLTRESTGAFGPRDLFGSEAQFEAWRGYNAARDKLPPDYRECIDGIVLEERDPFDVGREVGHYSAPAQATAVAMFVLRRGLEHLARHFGLLAEDQTGELRA